MGTSVAMVHAEGIVFPFRGYFKKIVRQLPLFFFFFLNDPPPPETSPLPLHAALPIPLRVARGGRPPRQRGRVRPRRRGVDARRLQRPPAGPPAACRVGLRQRVGPRRLRGAVRRLQDRKSTRLNSSHLVISYAVFCLKK